MGRVWSKAVRCLDPVLSEGFDLNGAGYRIRTCDPLITNLFYLKFFGRLILIV